MIWKILKFIPLTALAMVVYNIVAFSSGAVGNEDANTVFRAELPGIPMISGANWTISYGELLIFFGLILLFFEVIKATRISAAAMADHALSTLIFIAFLIEFLLVREAGTMTFFLLMIISLIDVIAGYIIGIRVARRDMAFGGSL